MTFTYYLKEDGIWILACIGFIFLSVIVFIVWNIIKYKRLKLIKFSIIFFIPFIVFIGLTAVYKSINYHYFGVYETQTRTEGEIGNYISNVYKIKSENRTAEIWAPIDAIEKSFNVSPTLSSRPELLDSIKHSSWVNGDIYSNPIKGDFLGWVLRTSLPETGLWTSEQNVSIFFKSVNTELESAFNNGVLEKDTRIQLISSAGGRTIDEIIQLNKLVGFAFRGALFLEGYLPGASNGNALVWGIANTASKLTNEPDLLTCDRDESYLNSINNVINIIFVSYRTVNIVLIVSLISAVCFAIRNIYKIIRKKQNFNPCNLVLFALIILFLGYSLAYAVGISWFSSFISGIDDKPNTILNFYTVALPVLLTFSFIWASVYVAASSNLNLSNKNHLNTENL